MTQRGTGAAMRTRRLIPWALFAAEMAVGVLALVLAKKGQGPLLGQRGERVVAYAWVAVTVGTAAGAYLLTLGTGAAAPAPRRSRTLVASGLTHLAALAGILAFWLVPVWPMLAVGGLAAVAGLALALSRGAAPAAGEGGAALPVSADDAGAAAPAAAGEPEPPAR